MLDQSERYRVLKSLRHFCTAGFLPLDVDLNSWEIQPCIQPRWKRLLCQISFAIYCSHTVCTSLRLLHVLIFLPDTPMYQIVIHMILASAYAATSFIYYLLFIKDPKINAAVFGMTLNGSTVGRKRNRLLVPKSSQVKHIK